VIMYVVARVEKVNVVGRKKNCHENIGSTLACKETREI